MSQLIADLTAQLAELDGAGLKRRRRTLQSPCGVQAMVDGQPRLAFCSNDYLGLANDPRIVAAMAAAAEQWGTGSGASPVVSGHLGPFEQLEQRLAAFVGRERALFFCTGYMANLGVTPTLVGRGEAIFHDKLNHASLIDAVQLSRADSQRYPHGDTAALARLLAASTAKRKLILTDAIFSMDGDLAPLNELYCLAVQHDAWLVVDDAHGFGVLGPQGRGSLAHLGLPADPRIVYMGTLGKAAGVSGAFVAGDATVIEWLLQRSRPYIFTTSPSPAVAGALLASIDLIEAADDRRAHLQALIAQLRSGLAGTPWQLLPSDTSIQPIVVGDNDAVLAAAAALDARGLWVPAIRPPTVPKGQARLRVSLSAAHQSEHVAALIDALRDIA
jgi:8-amino-7-oxononanoate synthase